jgi:hypothetical protein
MGSRARRDALAASSAIPSGPILMVRQPRGADLRLGRLVPGGEREPGRGLEEMRSGEPGAGRGPSASAQLHLLEELRDGGALEVLLDRELRCS